MKLLSSLLLLACSTSAYQFPLSIPFLQIPFQKRISSAPHRIAIIGAGAGGSSAAFWLSKAQNSTQGLDISVDVFEKETYIGGRSTVVYPYNFEQYDPVELGASIFVKANQNLWRATEEFNLSFTSFGDEDGELGIWDGKEFRFRAQQKGGDFSWWDLARLLWRYGIDAPRRSQALVKNVVTAYSALYQSATPAWGNVTDISDYLGFSNLTRQTSEEYFDGQKINKKYSSEMIEGMTRVNYGQNLDQIHALEGLVSQAASGASSVKGGNYQIFEQFLARSGAKLYLNSTVSSLTRKSNKWNLVVEDGEPRTYDTVILAAPFHSTGITITPPPRTPIPKQPYVHLHVTLLTTSSPNPNPAYFSLPADSKAPTTVLTTHDGFLNGGLEPEFNSLSYHGKIQGHGGRPAEHLVKIFSSKVLNDTWLGEVFGKVGWVLRKEWDAYPWLTPTATFPPVKPDEGLYYVNSFEPFISTMETETVSSQNVVQLLLAEILESNATLCSRGSNSSSEGEVMKGWDCQ